MLYSPIFRSDSGLAAAERRRAPDTPAVAAAAMAKSRRFILLCSGCIILSCSSDRVRVAVRQIDITVGGLGIRDAPRRGIPFEALRSEERRVGKSVDLGGRRIIKKKPDQ